MSSDILSTFAAESKTGPFSELSEPFWGVAAPERRVPVDLLAGFTAAGALFAALISSPVLMSLILTDVICLPS